MTLTARTAGLAAFCLTLFSGVATATDLSYSSPFPSNHTTVAKGIEPLAKGLEEASGGDLKLTVYSGGVMAKGPATLSTIQRGIVDSGLVVPAWVTSQIPATDTIASLMLAVSDARVAAAAANEYYLLKCPECMQEHLKHNARPLAFYGSAPYHFECRQELDSLDDLAGKRVRATSTPLVNWVEQFGATIVAVPTEDIYQALQRGQADCNVGPLAYMHTLNLKEVVKWVSDMPFGSYYGASVLEVNDKTWKKLSDEERALVSSQLAKLVRDVTEGYEDDSAKARADGEASGVIFAEPSAAERKKLADHVDAEFKRVLALAKERGVGGDDPAAFLQGFLDTLNKWEKRVADMDGDFDAYQQALQDEIFSKL